MTEQFDKLRELGWRRSTLKRSKAKRAHRLPRKHFGTVRKRDVIRTRVEPGGSPAVVDLDEYQ